MSGFASFGGSTGSSFQFGSSSNNTNNTNNNNNNNNNNNFNNNNNSNTNNPNANTSNNAWGSSSNTNTPNISFNFGNNSSNNNNNNNFAIDDGMNPMIAMQRLHNEYNRENELCRFQTVLYNKIPSSINVNLFCNKPPLIRSIIWDQGIKNNPYPNKLVPVAICGYDQLNQRSNLCLAGHCSSIKRFEEITEKINLLKNKINICTKQSITDLKQTQIHLSHRLLAILRVFINYQNENNNLNNNLNAKEIKLRNVLQQMSAESKQLINLYGHINKLSFEKEDNNPHQNSIAIISTDAHHLNDPQNMKQMFTFLKQQQQFLQLLSKTVQNDIHDLDLIANGVQSKHNTPEQSILFNTFNTSSSAIFG